jgi:glycosyltransferase involved in cell wall biosynthesis
MRSGKTSCIIPFWNEDLYLFDVLKEVSRVNNIDEVICVDDASDNNNYLEIKRKHPRFCVIRLPENSGKTDAIREGLKYADGEYILLLDADLQHLDHTEIEKAVNAIKSRPDIDMLILRRVRADLLIRMYRGDVLFTGERILRKSDLLNVLSGQVKRWQLESAVNTWMYGKNKSVYWMAQSATNTDKAIKWGLLRGLVNDIRTFGDMMFATGFNNFVKQILFYAKDELKVN